jgi:hypothetical protein
LEASSERLFIVLFPSDDEKIFQGRPLDQMWEQFAQVATDLLESLQSCMSLESSPIASFDFEEDDGIPVEKDN